MSRKIRELISHFLVLRSMTSPPAAWMAAVEPVEVDIHMPLDHTLNENICVGGDDNKIMRTSVWDGMTIKEQFLSLTTF